MKIGDVVYVVHPSYHFSSLGNLAYELKVLSDPVKNTKYCGRMVYKAAMLKNFNFEHGWRSGNGVYNYRVKDTYLTKESAFAALQNVQQEALKYANYSVKNALDSLESAQKSVAYSRDRLSTLENLNLQTIFGLDTYVSPFTGKIL